MTGPLTYLALHSTRNRLLRQARRLRTPRYAIALLLGLAYLWAVGVWQRPASGPPGVSEGTIELHGAAGLALLILYAWIFGADRRALAFTRAEVTWLFPAPLVRRQLIQYKLFRGQFVVFFNVILWTFLLSRGWAGVDPWRRAAGIWVLLTTLSLHRLGVALFRSSLAEHGIAGVRSRAITLALLGLILGAVVVDSLAVLPALRGGWDRGPEAFFAAMGEVADRPVARAILAPCRWMIRPLFAESWAAWAGAMVPAAGLLLLHFVWVLRSDAAFEEAASSAALARRPRRQRHAYGSTYVMRRVPALAASGWPGGALLWKNLAAVVRAESLRSTLLGFSVAVAIVAGLTMAGAGRTVLEIVGWLAASWSAFLLLLGPQWIRNDLRTDLGRLAVLRSYPLRGRTVVGVETAGSTTVLTAIQLGLVAIAYLAFWGGRVDDPSPELRTAVLAGVVVGLPAINFLGMLIQNGAALLFPAWVRIGPDRPIGIEALGQNMLVMLGYLAILAVLLILPAAVAVGVVSALGGMVTWWTVLPSGLAALLIVTAEAHLLLTRLGKIFEATDPSSVAPVESS
jgi:ABC-2 type transport system permease protein